MTSFYLFFEKVYGVSVRKSVACDNFWRHGAKELCATRDRRLVTDELVQSRTQEMFVVLHTCLTYTCETTANWEPNCFHTYVLHGGCFGWYFTIGFLHDAGFLIMIFFPEKKFQKQPDSRVIWLYNRFLFQPDGRGSKVTLWFERG